MDSDRREKPFGFGAADGAHRGGVIGVALRHFKRVVLAGVVNAPIVVPGQWGLRGSQIPGIKRRGGREKRAPDGTRVLELLVKI